MEFLKVVLYILCVVLLLPFLVYISARAWWDGYFNSRRDHKLKFKKEETTDGKNKG